MSEDFADEFEEYLAEQLKKPEFARAYRQASLTSLPLRVRLRLAVVSAVDSAGIWLTCHDHYKAAEWLWRITGLWGKR